MPSQPRMPFLSFLLQTQLSSNLLQEVFPDSSQDRALQTPQYFHPLTHGVYYLWALILSLPDLQAPLAGKMICSLCRLWNHATPSVISPPSLGLSSWGHMEITSPEHGRRPRTQCLVSLGTSLCSGFQFLSLYTEEAGLDDFWSPSSLDRFTNKQRALNPLESNLSHLLSWTSQPPQFPLSIHLFIVAFRAWMPEAQRPKAESWSLVMAASCKLLPHFWETVFPLQYIDDHVKSDYKGCIIWTNF